MSLDFTPQEFKNHLRTSADILEEWYATRLRHQNVYNNFSPGEIQQMFDEPLPVHATPVGDLLEKIRHDVFQASNFNPSPNYYGYITGGGNQAAILAELLRNGLNQNNLKWHSAPANSEIEKIVIKWICEFIGYPSTAGGVLVSGGSVGNFLQLAVMRKIKCPVDIATEGMYGVPKMTVYVSAEGHSSIDKGMDMLGLGKKHLRKIPVDEHFQMNTDLLEEAIASDLAEGYFPACVIGIAGTTNTGAIDPLRKLGEIAKKYNLWYIVDGAYGLPGAGTRLVGELFDGFEMADAILLNPHKWFFVPFEVAAVIVKDKHHLRSTFSMIPDYLLGGKEKSDREDLMDINLQLSKDFKALKVWMTFKAYGAPKLQEVIENDCRLAWYAAKKFTASHDFEVLAPVPLSILCFRFIGENGCFRQETAVLNQLNQRILELIEEDGRVFFAGTKLKGQTALRINLTNHRRTEADIDFLVDVLRTLGNRATEELTEEC